MMKAVHKTVSRAIAAIATAAAAVLAVAPASVANAAVLDSGGGSALLKDGAGSGEVGSQAYDSSTVSSNLQKAETNGPVGLAGTAEQEQQYDVHGNVISAAVYQKFHVYGPEDMVFDGDAGGLTIPGAGAFWGTLFTSDLQRLYKDTVSFQYNALGTYLNINFFDSSGGFLGHIQAGAVSAVVGVGGGSGSWHNWEVA
ncbi:virulence-associated protein VapB [Prescottella equi]|uniref:virulence-associated protein VapB n=1 Tax=Rhodococcus hoagii TaxID=43767 RepID=UPI001EEB4F0E|nr:virulence-associated protein VapB [Prescottella equi]